MIKYEELLEKIYGTYSHVEISKDKTALLLIDMQMLSTSESLLENAKSVGIDEDEAKEALKEYDKMAIPAIANAKLLLEACREKGITPIHVRVASYSDDGIDTGLLHKRLGFVCPPNSKWAQWMPEVAPISGEIQLRKTCSGAVVGSMLDRVLSNMGIENIIGVGFYTDQCVETTLRDLADCGYYVSMAVDATATETKKRHQNTVENICNVYVSCETTESLLNRIKEL